MEANKMLCAPLASSGSPVKCTIVSWCKGPHLRMLMRILNWEGKLNFAFPISDVVFWGLLSAGYLSHINGVNGSTFVLSIELLLGMQSRSYGHGWQKLEARCASWCWLGMLTITLSHSRKMEGRVGVSFQNGVSTIRRTLVESRMIGFYYINIAV